MISWRHILYAAVAGFSMLACLMATPAHARKQGRALIDSLKMALPHTNEDTVRAGVLTRLGYTYSTMDHDTGRLYAEQGLALAQKLGWEHGMAEGNNIMGICYYYKPDYTRSLEYWNKALAIFKQQHDAKGVVKVIGNIGAIYIYQSEYSTALESYFTALKYAEELGDSLSICINLGNIGAIYEYLKEDDKALEYDRKALRMATALRDTLRMALYLGNMGVVYTDLRQHGEALEHELLALQYNERLESWEGVIRGYGNMSRTHDSLGNVEQALACARRATAIAKEKGFKMFEGYGYSLISGVYLGVAKASTGKLPERLGLSRKALLDSVLYYAQRAIVMHKENESFDNLLHTYMQLSEAHTLLGNYKEALENYKQVTALKDSLFSAESKIKVTNLETKRAIELKDKQIEIDRLAVAKKRNERTFFIAALAMLCMVAGILFRNLRLKAARELSENKLTAFQARMNPHFIFNSLNSIQSLVLNNETISSVKYLSEFSRLMRQILDNSAKNKTSLKEEVQMLRSYIELEQLRFERFTWSINVAESIQPEAVQVPSMIIQPFVENAIIHGILPKAEEGVLNVSFTKGDRHIVCTVDDNGIGRERSAELNHRKGRKRESHGINIASSRLALLGDKRKGAADRVVYIDKKEGGVATGTTVIIQIPIL